MSALTLHYERVIAAYMPDCIGALVDQGLVTLVRPRGPHGSHTGPIAVRACFSNPEPMDIKDRYGRVTETIPPHESLTLVSPGGKVRHYPMKYRFGRGWRNVSFRVFTK